MQTVKLSELYEGLFDGPHATPKPADSGPIFLGIKNITEDGRLDLSNVRHISEEEFPKWTKRVTPQAGDIVFSYEATLHRYAIIPEGFHGCLGRRMALIRPNPEKVNTEYLFNYFFSEQWRTEVNKYILSGATVDRIPLTKVPDFEVTVHDRDEQDDVAEVVSNYNNLIENNNSRIAILEDMAQSLYREWFVKFRYPGHDKPSGQTVCTAEGCPEGVSTKDGANEYQTLVDSPLGAIPEGWEVRTIEECYKTSSGGTPSRKKPEYYSDDHWWVKTKELKDGFVTSVEEKISDLGLSKSSAKLFPKDSVLLAMYGATIGRLGILTHEASTNQACCALMPLEEKYSPWFIYLTLLEKRPDLLALGQGAAQQNISQQVIKGFKILIPQTTLLEQFSAAVEPIFRQIEVLLKSNLNLKKQRDMLLPKLISGKINLNGPSL